MKHLQGECVFHLSALAAAAIMQLKKERDQLAEAGTYQNGWDDAMGTVYGE